MKKLIIATFAICICLQSLGQKRPKYEDELPNILALPSSGKIALLNVYQKEDPDNASINLQKAVVYNDRFQNSDILTDYRYKYGNAIAALTALRMANIQIDDRDVRKREEHYINFGTVDDRGRVDVEYDTVKAYMDAADPILAEFIEKAPGIYQPFTQSFSYYDEAHKTFTSLLGNFTTEKDLLLLYDEEVDERMEDIKSSYLKSVEFFRQYQDSVKNYPIGYQQELVIKDLNIYRLDGLEANINFLEPTVEVWNYAKWVDETRAFINANIDKLRLDLAKEHLRVEKVLGSATPDFIRDEFEPLDIDKELLFTLRKYDLRSVVEPLFLYKEAKHDLLYQELLSSSLDTSQTVDADRKLYLFGQMINKITNADSVLNRVLDRNTDETHEKYEDFLTTYYKGQEGVREFVKEERLENQQDFSGYVGTVRDIVYEKLAIDSSLTEVRYRRTTIPFIEQAPVDTSALTEEYVTTHKIVNFDGSAFIGGIVKNTSENKAQAFVAGITKNGQVGWYNDYLLQIDSAGFDAHTRVAAMQVIPGGVAFILNGSNPSTGQRINHLMLLDETGEVTLSRRMLFTQYPRTITYNERENSLIVTFKGEDYVKDIFINNELILAKFNILGDLQWQTRLEYKGDVAAVTGILDGYILSGNYNTLKNLDGKMLRAGASNTDTKSFLLKVSTDGEILALKDLESPRPYFVNKTYKVSDDCINLLGAEESYNPSEKLIDGGNAVHFIVNSNLDVLSSSIN